MSDIKEVRSKPRLHVSVNQSIVLRQRSTIKETKRAYYSNLIQENKNHSSKLWSAIKSAIGSDVKASQIQSLEIDGEDITDPKQISASFASFFKSIIANLRQTLPVPAVSLCSPRLLTGAQFSLSQITVDFVYKQLKALNSKKSSGLHDIPVRLVKDGAEALVRPLTLLMNRTINEGSLPSRYRHACSQSWLEIGSIKLPAYLSTPNFLQNTWTGCPPYGLQLFRGTQASFSSPVRLSPTPLYLHTPRTCDKHSAGKHWQRSTNWTHILRPKQGLWHPRS